MSDVPLIGYSPPLEPPPYFEAIRAYLKEEEAAVWNWYAGNRARGDQADAVRFELLKSTYRLTRDEQPALYASAEDVARRLGLDVPVTLYQAQNPQHWSASLAYMPGEAHLVLEGPVSTKLTEAEFRAVLAHELSHVLLYSGWEGEYLVVAQVLAAMTNDAMAEPSHFASARLLSLYSEVFCDRGALRVAGDPLAVVSMLLKLHTEIDEVNPASFLAQAEEVFRHEEATAQTLTHPEAFIRARAVKLWADGDPQADAKIAAMIEGPPRLDALDLLARRRVEHLTRRLIDRFLVRRWMQSESVLAHARLFFDEYAPPESRSADPALADDLRTADSPMQDYYCYVLLDFVTADRDLEELPLAAGLRLAEDLGLKDRFLEIVRQELRLRKKQLEAIDQNKDSLLAEADGRKPER